MENCSEYPSHGTVTSRNVDLIIVTNVTDFMVLLKK